MSTGTTPDIGIRGLRRAAWTSIKARYAGSSGSSRLARAASWNVLGGAASKFLSLAASFLVARALGKAAFGQLGMVQLTFLALGVFASLGLGMTATRFISLYRPTSPDRAGRIAAIAPLGAGLLSALGALGVFVFAPWLARVGLNNADLAPVLRLAAPLLLLGALQDASQGVLAGLEAFRVLARVTAIAGAALAVGMIAGAQINGLRGCILGMVIGMTLGYAVTLLAVRAEIGRAGLSPSLSGWAAEIPSLWRFALPAVLGGGVVLPVNWLANSLLIHQPQGDEQMGLFSAAHQMRIVILYVPGLVATAGLPVLTHLWKHTSGNEYFRLIRLKVAIGFITSSLVAIPAILAAPWIMAGFGPGYPDGVPVLRVLAGTAIITATLNMIGQAIISEGRMWTGLLLNFIWAGVLISLSWYWIPSHGALGLAWANLAAFSVHLIAFSVYVLRRSRETGPRHAPSTA